MRPFNLLATFPDDDLPQWLARTLGQAQHFRDIGSLTEQVTPLLRDMERMRDLYNHVLHDQFSLVSAVLPVTAYAAEQRRAIEAMMHSLGSGISEMAKAASELSMPLTAMTLTSKAYQEMLKSIEDVGCVFGSRRFRR